MRHPFNRILKSAALALILSVGACSDESNVMLLGPGEGPSESLSLADDLEAIQSGARPDLSVRSHEVIIGPSGGSLYVDLHYLHVPRGAVDGPTKFRIELRDDHKIGAKLTATSVNRQGEETGPTNNVGSAGFDKPVYLTFSYQFATNTPKNPASIKVVQILDGQLIPQPTKLHEEYQAVTGTLKHFSDYGIAWPRR